MNRQKLLPTLFLFLLSALAFGQGWERMYTAPSQQSPAQIRKALPVPDGFLLLISDVTLDLDFHITKIDQAGQVQWTRHYDFGHQEDATDFIATSDGGYAVVYTVPASAQTSYLVKLDDQFNVVFNQQLTGVGVTANLAAHQVIEEAGTLHVFGTYAPPDFGNNQSFRISVNAAGNMVGSALWSPTATDFAAATPTANGEVIGVARGFTTAGPSNSLNLAVARFNPSGGANLWEKNISDPDLPYYPHDIVPAIDGGYLVAGGKGGNGLLLKLDDAGNTLWEKVFPYQNDSLNFLSISRLVPNADATGYLAIAGSDSYIPQIMLLQIDLQGNLLSRKPYGPFFKYNYGYTLLALTDGALIGGSSTQLNDETYPYAIRTDANGETFGNAVSGTVLFDFTGDCIGDVDSLLYGSSVEAWQGNNLVASTTIGITGEYLLPLDTGNYDITVHRLNAAWVFCGPDTIPVTVLPLDTVEQVDFVEQYNPQPIDSLFGSVFQDYDGDCVRDSFEPGYAGWSVVAVVYGGGLAQTFTATTDANGHFVIDDLGDLDNSASGNFTISPPQGDGLNCTVGCPDAFHISFQNGNSYEASFGVHCDSLPPCPVVEVEIATNSLRPCFSSTYHVHYCNIGAVVAENASVAVTLDSALQVTASSIPWASASGNTYTFNVGNLAPEECGDFTITVFVPCDDPVGQTYCATAHAYPDTICQTPGANWDGSQIEVTAVCQGDSVVFTIHNVGDGDMQIPLNYIVIEDNVLLMQGGSFQLTSGSTTSVSLPATGSFFRLQADQSPGFPAFVQPSAWVEGCNSNNPSGTFSMGFINQYPFNDDDPWLDEFCLESNNSYDPNDKQGFPRGYGNEHLIGQNTDIEYLVRFQNTGTAPALNVEIRDTIPVQFLDPTSVRPGASSHPYQWDMQGNGVVVFRFADINLPDSSSNLAASQGFVKFRVAQRKDVPLSSVIKNDAAIFFDFNEPIITNTTVHTIGENFIVLEATDPHLPQVLLTVSPNPLFTGLVTVKAQGWDKSEPLDFQLHSALGKSVLNARFGTTGSLEFQADALPAGLYFYEVRAGETVVGTGKLVKVR